MKWRDLPRLPRSEFTWENSGIKACMAPPGTIMDDGEIDCPSWTYYTPVGWTLDPPFAAGFVENTEQSRKESVAIMYESSTGERTWWHHLRDDYDPDIKVTKLMPPKERCLDDE